MSPLRKIKNKGYATKAQTCRQADRESKKHKILNYNKLFLVRLGDFASSWRNNKFLEQVQLFIS